MTLTPLSAGGSLRQVGCYAESKMSDRYFHQGDFINSTTSQNFSGAYLISSQKQKKDKNVSRPKGPILRYKNILRVTYHGRYQQNCFLCAWFNFLEPPDIVYNNKCLYSGNIKADVYPICLPCIFGRILCNLDSQCFTEILTWGK